MRTNKKIIIVIGIITIFIFTSITVSNIFLKEENKTKIINQNNTIGIIVEGQERDSFPSKQNYEFEKAVCNGEEVTAIDEGTDSFNIKIENLDKTSNCVFYFIDKIVNEFTFDFINTNALSNFVRTSGEGTFANNSTNGLHYATHAVTSGESATIYQYDLNESYQWDNFTFTINYKVENVGNSLGNFYVALINSSDQQIYLKYEFTDAWALQSSGGSLTMIVNDTQLYYANYSPNNLPYDGTITITKNGTSVASTGKYAATATIDGAYSFDRIEILISIKYGTYPLTTMNIRNFSIVKN